MMAGPVDAHQKKIQVSTRDACPDRSLMGFWWILPHYVDNQRTVAYHLDTDMQTLWEHA